MAARGAVATRGTAGDCGAVRGTAGAGVAARGTTGNA
jgi:hypothetical protein